MSITGTGATTSKNAVSADMPKPSLVGAGVFRRTTYVPALRMISVGRSVMVQLVSQLLAQVQSPHAEQPVIYLWEAAPGGVGMSPRLFERTDELIKGALELVSDCDYEVGCPACVGPRGDSRLDGRALAASLLRMLHQVPAAERPDAPAEVAA